MSGYGSASRRPSGGKLTDDRSLLAREHVAFPVITIGDLAIRVLARRCTRAGDPEHNFVPAAAGTEPVLLTGHKAAGTPLAFPAPMLASDCIDRVLSLKGNAIAGPNRDTKTPDHQKKKNEALDHGVNVERELAL